MIHVAKFQEALNDNKVVCKLCPHNCVISENKSGICKVRVNKSGKLYSLNYGVISAETLDPIEKKPLYHFLPGSDIYSIGTFGCNMKCNFCQNWSISQRVNLDLLQNECDFYSPEEFIEFVKKSGSNSIAFTYNEPSIWYEFVYDTAVFAKENDIKTVMVTNGYINEEPLLKLSKYIDAFALDVKGFTDEFYKKYTGGTLNPVLKNAEFLYNSGRHVEIITLIIPGLNDDIESLEKLFNLILENLSDETPVHLNAFHPNYKLNDLNSTSYDSLKNIGEFAKKTGLKHIYIGNVRNPDPEFKNTYCPNCNNLWIERNGYNVSVNETKDISGKKMICTNCGFESKTIVLK